MPNKTLKPLALLIGLSLSQAATAGPTPNPNPQPDVPPQVGSCADYQVLTELPHFAKPAKKKFRSWGNRFLSRFNSPYHMVHDQIVNPGESARVVGKFDYSRTLHKDLEKEYVKAYLYGTGMSNWQYLGRYKTDRDGKIYVNTPSLNTGEYIVRMVVEGDLTQADGFVSVVPKGQQTVLFDIDGTLTLSDFEQVGDYLGVSTAQRWNYAKETVQAYLDRGYRVIYVTGRPYWIARDSREWFTDVIELPQWHLRTNDDGGSPLSYETEAYKRQYLSHLINDKGLNIVRAYGNADTDISAYAGAGISKSETWIIGTNAGNEGTQPIYGDYSTHYFEHVLNTPYANCIND